MGAATAFYLRKLEPARPVVVVERDPSYRQSSTLLSDGNVRIQFNLEENIRMSQYAMDVLDSFSDEMAVGSWRPEVTPRRQGNLFLTDAANRSRAEAGLVAQRALECEVEWLDRPEIIERYQAYEGSGYVGGTFGPKDGSVDPSAVMHGYIRKAQDLGATFVAGEAARILTEGDDVTGVSLTSGESIASTTVVDAAGAWCAQLAATAGVDLPVQPVMRSVYVVETAVGTEGLPSVFLPSGLYVLPESARRFLIGWSLPDDPVGFDFTLRRQRFFDVVWPELATTFPAFEALHLVGGWTGLYEVNTLDGNAILGEWPGLRGLYLANGFSGHGFQQCHAVGRHLAELIVGRPPSLNLSRFGAQRVVNHEPIFENPDRII
jgi:glycine/D-amino acid oxidase-like deaminating enzyme